jgi:hypothetical protein
LRLMQEFFETPTPALAALAGFDEARGVNWL